MCFLPNKSGVLQKGVEPQRFSRFRSLATAHGFIPFERNTMFSSYARINEKHRISLQSQPKFNSSSLSSWLSYLPLGTKLPRFAVQTELRPRPHRQAVGQS